MKRSQVLDALDTLPDRALLGAGSKELTAKQRKFAREVAKGATKAEAYRRSYKAKPGPRTILTEPYKLAANPVVAREIEAHRQALEAMEYRSPAALRALIVQTLTQTLLDPDVAPAVRIQAARVLGTVTEVSAFTHRSETTVIKKSDDAKAQLLKELQDMMRTVNADGHTDAEALLAELAEPHPAPTHPIASDAGRSSIHTIPHNESPNEIKDLPENTPPDVLK